VSLAIDPELFRTAGRIIDEAGEVMVVSHRRPDGDAIGSTVGVLATLKQRGRRAWGLLLDPVPARYRSLCANGPIEVWSPAFDARRIEQADVVLVLDTSCWEQLDAVQDLLRRRTGRMVVVDHHETHNGIGAVHLIDPGAAAAGLILYEWFRYLEWPMPPVALHALFAAIATDTGWFRFSNTDVRALQAAAELVRAGVEPNRCYEAIYWSDTPARLALMAKALQGMTLHENGRLAVMQIDRATIAACGAGPSDTEDLINEPMRIGSVIVSALLVEDSAGRVRVSLRSKGQINVAALAATLGGGGHARAAGIRLDGPMTRACQQMVELLSNAIRRNPTA
jgi:phosphoesterase RecJ-like protein